MAQLTDDCFAHGGRLMRTDEAHALLADKLTCITEAETVALPDALGRILAEDVTATADVPPHDNAAVDGYAVYFEDLSPDRETRLPIGGRVAAGHSLEGSAARGQALRIFTGAPLPPGPDTIMMQEDCSLSADGKAVTLRPGIKRGANRRDAGEDITAGTTVLQRGQRLRPQDLGQAAAVGRPSLQVSRPLRSALPDGPGSAASCRPEAARPKTPPSPIWPWRAPPTRSRSVRSSAASGRPNTTACYASPRSLNMLDYFVDKSQCSHHEIFPGVHIYTTHGEHMMLSLVEFEPHAVVEEHQHPHEQMGLMLEGEAEFIVGSEQRTVRAGEMWRIPGNVPHKVIAGHLPVKALDVFYPIREDYK